MRRLLLLLFAIAATQAAAADAPLLPVYPEVRPGVTLSFPRDHGAHPEYRTEWWYITGWLTTEDGKDLGFQVTFFRSRPSVDQRNPSAFAPKQLLFAHAALSDSVEGRLEHDQRAARAGFGLASAAETDTDIRIDDWSLVRTNGAFVAKTGGTRFALDLTITPTQDILLQGENGYSQKGPEPTQASHYYSLPHLKVSGTVRRAGRVQRVTGSAWLDREWSSTLLDPRAVGWDWIGINLDDGGALMAFQVRGSGGEALWAGGAHRRADGRLEHFAKDDVRFATRRSWRSPRTGATYPVERDVFVRLEGGERQWRITPLFDDQELDSRGGGGPVYWEGAVRTEGGRGYLELTGYLQPLKL